MSHKVSAYVHRVRFVIGEESSDVFPFIIVPEEDYQIPHRVSSDLMVIYASNVGLIVFDKNGNFVDFCRLKPESKGFDINNLCFNFPHAGEINFRDFVNAELSCKKEGFVDIESLNVGWALGNVPESFANFHEEFDIPERFLRGN